MRTALLCGVVLVVGAAAASATDEYDDLPGGSRLRITLKEGAMADPPSARRPVGTLVRLETDELALRSPSGQHVLVSQDAIERIEISRGPHSRKRGALLGAGVAAAAGVLASVAWGTTCKGDECQMGTGFGLMLYTPLAALVGGGIGAAIPPGERWEPVSDRRVRLQLRPAKRGASMALAVSF